MSISESEAIFRGQTMSSSESEAILQGQADIWQYMFNFADSMALRCAVELRIADIINSHGHPITLSQIANGIDSPSPDISCLRRILRLLVRKKIFTAHTQSEGGETVYGLTHSSKWILHHSEQSLAPMLLMETHPWLMAPWHHLSECVKQGGEGFSKAHGCDVWEFAAANGEFNRLFNDGMGCTFKIAMRALVEGYRDGFGCIKTLVDVGGGTGATIAEIVKAYPEIKGINFDLPHVVATAPEYPGVSHVGGDMFTDIPRGDAVFMKWIMHDWEDTFCVKILKNCRKAIPEKSGKVIIVEAVLQRDNDGLFNNMGFVFDILMMAHSGGKERTETEWKNVLEAGGFMRYKIIKIPSILSIIEAYPE